MLVPAAVEDLHEADTPFDEATGREATIREGPTVLGIRAVELKGLL